MLKYIDTQVVMAEVPDEITLAINISNCPHKCEGCHSPWLWKDEGMELTEPSLLELIAKHDGISCVALMGGDSDPEYVVFLASVVRIHHKDIKVCWYSGFEQLPPVVSDYIDFFDYIKLGPYMQDRGGLDCPDTNQRFYKVVDDEFEDITFRFQKKLTR